MYQFWQYYNQPIELFDAKIMEQKADYLHDNPGKAGFVGGECIGNTAVLQTIVVAKG